MDRAAFLSSLPFLIPLQSTAWPPTAGGSGSKMFLGDSYDSRSFLLSIDVTLDIMAEGATSRPAFFKTAQGASDRSTTNSDSSLAPIQLVVVEYSGDSSSAVYLRVDEHVYVVDLRQSKKLEVVPESYETEMDDDDDTSYRRRKVSQPCSLVLQFDCVLLRIFRNNLEACREDKDTLVAVCQTLSKLENTVFAVSIDDISSPSRSSTSGSGSSTTVNAGQKDDSAILLGVTPPTPVATGNKRSSADHEHNPPVRIQRHRATFHESLSSLSTVRQVLDMPVSAITSRGEDGDHGNGNLSLGPLLSRTAHLTSLSFVSGFELTTANEHYESLLQRNQQEMEHTLGFFFPAPHRGARGRYTSKNDEQQQPQQVSGATAARAFSELMEQHKRIVEDRHNLFLLPTRG